MRAIILTPDAELNTHADRVAWVRCERDILANDIAAAGGRLIAATAFVWPRESSDFRALMRTCAVNASTDIVGACATASDLLTPLINEAKTFAYARGAESLSFELTVGSEVLGWSDAETLVVLPAMTETGRRDS
ncbi:hypothetical protein [Mesorhizobium sp. B1-1-5]|uniref:hypothetical protein n=1 Tax=Mesorhizobium sp. B1-1-5 TaxID=2589979 RepID=UPI0011267004|nr:hypothetical protein [Mesorhizobium sp. B1-1-5]TPO02196.1 hypothetical protein FJ980_18745 [Mesorhizobium sp. B1-1-5]